MRFFPGQIFLASQAACLLWCASALAAPQAAPPQPQKNQAKAGGPAHSKTGEAKVVPRVLAIATPDTTRIYVSLGKQRAYLLVGDEVAIDTRFPRASARA